MAPWRAIDGDGAPIAGVLDGLDAGCRARFQEGQHRLPVVGRTVGEAEAVALRAGCDMLPGQPPQLGRRSCVGAPNLAVEAANAAEARCERDLVERECRLVEELLREVKTPRVGDVERRRAEVLQKRRRR